jgi:MoaA/NifB/PqqE/SkfB family radical SAM enzyme
MQNLPVNVEKMMQHIKTSGVEWVFITGGEPFRVDNLPEICDTLKSWGFKVGITTNGTIFRPQIANHADRIGVSLDGDKKYHDDYRGEGVFDKAMSLIEALKNRCELIIMSTAFSTNQIPLLNLKPIVEKINPDFWQIQRDYNDPSVIINENL